MNVQTPNCEMNFLSAQEATEKTSKQWQTRTTEEIFDEIQKATKSGKRYVYFFNAYLTGKSLTILRELGYEVKIDTLDKAPFFKVSW